jgi:hypothetical protein
VISPTHDAVCISAGYKSGKYPDNIRPVSV